MSESAPLSTAAPERATVLVVEDDPVLNRLLVRQLAKAGYDVGSAHSWAEARERLPRLQPDLVLLDMKLPDSAGWVPLTETAADRPVVMLTAYGNVAQAVEAMRLGAADYLVKPVDLEALERVVAQALQRAREQRARAEALVLTGEPTLDTIEREYLQRLLRKYAGNRRKVAEALGVSERTAYRMLDRHGLRQDNET
ncbi:MAG: response regulator [Burkholderiaceae bacterium]|jgi:DNA-binding NtrC family response regulator|nr:response regulator [Burkholderiaceae bacterium]